MNSKRYTRIAIWIVGALALGMGVWRVGYEVFKPRKLTTGRTVYGTVPDFELTDRSGKNIGLQDLKGKVWVADFVFTRCSGPCPWLTSRMADLQKEFAAESDLRFVSFTVDPGFDSPEVLARYAKAYKADDEKWFFLTGPTEKLYRLIVEDFHLALERDPKAAVGESVNHSLSFVLVDRHARVRGYYTGTEKQALDALRGDIKTLL